MSNYRRYYNELSTIIFLTFVTYKRRNILLENIDIFKQSLKFTKQKFEFEIVAICVLQNHCHMLISTKSPNEVPKIVRTIKYNFSTNIPEIYYCKNLSESAINRGEKGVWQRRYYDHIIRNENDLNRHLDYIHYNSMKHYHISPKDWKYSSFEKFVNFGFYSNDWCNFGDKNLICELDLE